MAPADQSVIFTTYANVIDKPSEYLPAIGDERFALNQVFDSYVKKGWGLVKDSVAAPEYLTKQLIDWHKELVIFHFSGHANGELLQLVDRAGDGKGATGNNVVALLKAALPNLKLVFLNACLTEGHVNALLEAGVPAVIGTEVKIDDGQALVFSQTFYQALVKGLPLHTAFQMARMAIAADEEEEGLFMDAEADDLSVEELPWGLFYQDKAILNWTLKPTYAIDERLKRGSRTYFNKIVRTKGQEGFSISHHLLPPMAPARTEPRGNLLPSALTIHMPHISERPPLSQVMVSGEKYFGLVEPIQHLFEQKYPHVVIQAEGGMRKTAALLYLWQQFLDRLDASDDDQGASYAPIPIYISLSEYNLTSPSEKRAFITQFIAKYYLNERTLRPETESQLWTWLQEASNKGPKMILMLDGLNEVTVEKSKLLLTIREEWAELKPAWSFPSHTDRKIKKFQANAIHESFKKQARVEGNTPVQILITGHIGTDFQWAKPTFAALELQPLKQAQIQAYLHEHSKAEQDSITLLKNNTLLGNPSMLSLYVEYAANQNGNITTESISTAGELWDVYITSLIKKKSKLIENEQISPAARTRWQLHHLLPAICYQMVQKDRLEYRRMEFKETIEQYLNNLRLQLADYYEVFSDEESEQIWEVLEHREVDLAIALRFTFSTLSNEQDFLRRKGQTISFLQQSYRRYFAARHIINELYLSIERDEIPAVLKDAPLANYLVEMIGQILRAHTGLPTYNEAFDRWERYVSSTDLIQQVLNLVRGVYGEKDLGMLIWNIMGIWYMNGQDITGLDLTELDLNTNNINLNEIRCSRLSPSHPSGYFTADFKGSQLAPEVFFPEGHAASITALAFSEKNHSFLSASKDGSIRVWSVRRGTWMLTIEYEGAEITSLAFHPEETHFLSGAADGSITEWALQPVWQDITGVKLQRFAAHDGPIKVLNYEADGQSFISAGLDHQFKVWQPSSGDIEVFHLPKKLALPPLYLSIPDQATVCMGFHDGTILVEEFTGSYWGRINTGAGSVQVIGVMDGLGLVSGHQDGMLRAWRNSLGHPIAGKNQVHIRHLWSREPEFGNITTIREYPASSQDNRAAYFLAGSEDGKISLWNYVTGECLSIIAAHEGPVSAISLQPLHEDQSFIFSSGFDGTIQQFQIRNDHHIHTLTLEQVRSFEDFHQGAITDLIATQNYLFSGSLDQSIKLWFIHHFEEESHPSPIWQWKSPNNQVSTVALAEHEQDIYLAVGRLNGTATIFKGKMAEDNAGDVAISLFTEVGTPQQATIVDLCINVDWISDKDVREFDQPIVVMARENRRLEAIDLKTKKRFLLSSLNPLSYETPQQPFDNPTFPQAMAYFPKQRRLIASSPSGFHGLSFHSITGKLTHSLSQANPEIRLIAAHPTEDRLLTYHEGGCLQEWTRPPAQTYYHGRVIEVELPKIQTMSYTTHGNHIMVGDQFGDIYEVCLESGERVGSFIGKRLGITGLSISSDHRRLLMISDDNPDHYVIKEWDLTAQTCRYVYTLPNEDISKACYSKDMKFIFAQSSDDRLFGWSTISGKRIETFDHTLVKALFAAQTRKMPDMLPRSVIGSVGDEAAVLDGKNFFFAYEALDIKHSAKGIEVMIIGLPSGEIEIWHRKTEDQSWDLHHKELAHTPDYEYAGHRTITALTIQKTERGGIAYTAGCDGLLKLWDMMTGKCLDTWPNVSGLWIQGVNLEEVKWARPLTPREKKWLTLYGAIVD